MTFPGDSRTGLLDQAQLLFAAHGYDAVGVQQIVECDRRHQADAVPSLREQARTAEGSARREADAPSRRDRTAAIYRYDLAAALGEVAGTTFAFAQQHPELYRLYLTLWFAPSESEAYRAALPFHERHFVALETMFRAATADHGNMTGRHRAYAATFLGMVNNYASLALSGHTELDETLVRQAVHQFMHGIFS